MAKTKPGPYTQEALIKIALRLEDAAAVFRTIAESMATQHVDEITAGYAEKDEALMRKVENFGQSVKNGFITTRANRETAGLPVPPGKLPAQTAINGNERSEKTKTRRNATTRKSKS